MDKTIELKKEIADLKQKNANYDLIFSVISKNIHLIHSKTKEEKTKKLAYEIIEKLFFKRA